MGKRLYKSRDNKMISGVMGGIAEYFNIDATLVRILYCILNVFSSVPGIVVYIILVMVIPEQPRQSKHDSESEWVSFNAFLMILLVIIAIMAAVSVFSLVIGSLLLLLNLRYH